MSDLARLLVRLYPRAWRARYEDEFVVLLEQTGVGWSALLDIAWGAIREHGRAAWRFVLGRDAGDALPPLSGTKAFLTFVVLMSSGWIVGSWLDRFVSDDLALLVWLPLLFLGRLQQKIDAPPTPVWVVVHPWRPDRLIRVGALRWLRLLDTVLLFGWILPPALSRSARWLAAACVFVFGGLSGAASYVVRFSGGFELNFAWLMVPMMFGNWFWAVGEVFQRRPTTPEVPRRPLGLT
jgi:hypothetical protein